LTRIIKQIAPRSTIIKSASGNVRCSALASFQGARNRTSRSSSVARITGMALGVDRLDDRVRCRSQETIYEVRAGNGFDLVPRSPLNSVRRLSFNANQTTSFFSTRTRSRPRSHASGSGATCSPTTMKEPSACVLEKSWRSATRKARSTGQVHEIAGAP
jgi:hypothetical protein